MKRTILIFLILLLSVPAFAENDKYADPKLKNNPGYMKSYGMVGLFGFLPNFHSKSFRDGDIGGGAFAYYNLFNDFWGNVAIGLSSNYTSTRAARSNYIANYRITPVTFNIAYMTSSDILNFWAGAGVSYTFLNTEIRSVTSVDGVSYSDLHKKNSTVFLAGDVFVGGEYIFHEEYKLGVFFEFRYTFTEGVKLKVDYGDMNAKINDTMTLQRFRYAIGFSYHF